MSIEVAQMDAVGRLGVCIKRADALAFALDLICSLEQPIGRNDTDLMQAQAIAADALAKYRAECS
ncbi:MAG: hypothetical protein AB7R40_23685 [Nitrospiraceae bacterium]